MKYLPGFGFRKFYKLQLLLPEKQLQVYLLCWVLLGEIKHIGEMLVVGVTKIVQVICVIVL